MFSLISRKSFMASQLRNNSWQVDFSLLKQTHLLNIQKRSVFNSKWVKHYLTSHGCFFLAFPSSPLSILTKGTHLTFTDNFLFSKCSTSKSKGRSLNARHLIPATSEIKGANGNWNKVSRQLHLLELLRKSPWTTWGSPLNQVKGVLDIETKLGY